ncbi:MAG: hypothetical protein ACI91B_004407 [Planctomycetota bacterium]|jgi:hypothetical protein
MVLQGLPARETSATHEDDATWSKSMAAEHPQPVLSEVNNSIWMKHRRDGLVSRFGTGPTTAQ